PYSIFFCQYSANHPNLHSFPTRRSSDLNDRATYLQLLAKAASETAVRILAYALMSNHLHLVVHTPAPNLHVLIHRAHRPYAAGLDRKSTRLNSSHVSISYAVFCLKKKNN